MDIITEAIKQQRYLDTIHNLRYSIPNKRGLSCLHGSCRFLSVTGSR